VLDLADKAVENIEAARRLLPDERGDQEPLPNASVSRAYYAAYQAVAVAVQRAGRDLPGDGWFRHDALPRDGQAWGVLRPAQARTLALLHGSRVKADYYEDAIDIEEASVMYDHARALVEALLPEVER
jgi:hypothetical protein